MKKKNNSKNKKIIIAGVAGIILIGSAVGYKLYSDNQVKIKAELKKKMEQAKLDGICYIPKMGIWDLSEM